MKDLIIGGSSGLGLELARQFAELGDEVVVTGRQDPGVDFAKFEEFDLSQPALPKRMGELVVGLVDVSRVIYAAGYYQEGTLTDLRVEQIEDMIDVGERGLLYAVRAVLKARGKLDELITITSSSEYTPREKEPIYNLVKAGAKHLSNGIAEDGRVGKVLVVAPSGMRTKFWRDVERDDLDEMLDPKWVAEQIMEQREDDYQYKHVRILRSPPRVEETEKR